MIVYLGLVIADLSAIDYNGGLFSIYFCHKVGVCLSMSMRSAALTMAVYILGTVLISRGVCLAIKYRERLSTITGPVDVFFSSSGPYITLVFDNHQQ